MTDITIREALASDAVALATLCTQLGYPMGPAAVPSRLDRLAVDGNARVLVAERSDIIVGLATIHLRYTMNHHAPIAQLTLLVVDEKHRSVGVGRALVRAAEAWARERGSERLVVTTALHRAVAHAFYERLGYVHTGRRYAREFSAGGH
jgi:GNAT superfamily N-acetyltransferase